MPRTVDPRLDSRYWQLWTYGLQPLEIQRALQPLADELGTALPALRTLQDRSVALAASKLTHYEPWSLGSSDDDPISARFVLDVLNDVVADSARHRTTLTQVEADWAARLHEMYPSLPPLDAFFAAAAYVQMTDRGDATHELDLVLMGRPWETQGDWAPSSVRRSGLWRSPVLALRVRWRVGTPEIGVASPPAVVRMESDE